MFVDRGAFGRGAGTGTATMELAGLRPDSCPFFLTKVEN